MKTLKLNITHVLASMLLVATAGPAIAQKTTSKKDQTRAEAYMTKELQAATTPKQALERLKEGNQRFADGKQINQDYAAQVKGTSKSQAPFAFVLSCVDSRTSSEIIFDQGIGDIFNARIAGNFVNTDILGSMEFGCKAAGAKLIVVIGHSSCGAVKGACDHVDMGNLTNVMKEIEPAVESVTGVAGERTSKNNEFVEAVAKQNVVLALKEIREKSPILAEMESKGEIMIVGAMYDVGTGKVQFYQ